MAYQRPFLVSLKKGDPQQPWGFRIFGGKEYGEPHVVEKVIEGSVAERAGLREGDEIIQVGRNNIQDLSFGQAQDVIIRSGNKLEMFIIREDLLSPRKGKEPSYVKAVVHNPYNSPLNLYSTENIADALAKQTEVLTEGHILATDEEEGPENLSFKQKSAVFQLLEEQARQDSASQYQARGSPQQRKAAPTPPPKPKPPSVSNYQNKENFFHPEQQIQSTHTTTIQTQSYRAPFTPQTEDYYNQVNSVDYRKQDQKPSYCTSQLQHNFSVPQAQRTDTYQTSDQRSSKKVTPTPPPRATHPVSHNTMTTVYRQQQQPQYYEQQQTQQYQDQQEVYHQTQKQWPPPQAQPQQKIQVVKFEQQQQQSQEMNDPVFEQTSTSGTPITYKAPPSQKHRINWPPPCPVQQNGVWSSPSPTPASPSKANIEALWPPRQPTAGQVVLPRTGFNPAAVREQSSGRRCVWPPPKSDEFFGSGRTTPQSPMMGRRIQWNPSPSPPSSRRSPFGSISPVARRKDIMWPPPQPVVVTKEVVQHRPSPTCQRKARFDDYVKLHASSNVPTTYRAPPGTQHVEYC